LFYVNSVQEWLRLIWFATFSLVVNILKFVQLLTTLIKKRFQESRAKASNQATLR